jgi:N-acetyl sugar amidotransferase
MIYCKRCLYPSNHPLNITFDENGVCSGCRVHEEKDSLDWTERLLKLKKILNSYKTKSNNLYDCVIPVSGARDSYFIVHTIKKEFGLNPLLVSYNRHYNTKIGLSNLAYLRTIMDCDILTLTIKPEIVKAITKETLKRRASMHWHTLAGQSVLPVKVAVGYKIPLIIWGVHQGCDQVGMFSHKDEVEMTRKYRYEHDLMQLEAEDLIGPNLTEEQLHPYIYPDDKEIERVGVRGIYLSNYIRWDSKNQHEKMLKLYGYQVAKLQRTFDNYNDVDCLHYAGLHDYIKYLKFGYGKVTDHACREIRLKRLSRENAIKLVEKYEQIIPDDIDMFCKFIGISDNELMTYINNHRDARVWKKDLNNNWQLIDSSVDRYGQSSPDLNLSLTEHNQFVFQENSTLTKEVKLLNKGFTDIKQFPYVSNDC